MSNVEKKHFTTVERERFISDWRQSGLSKKQFAEERAIKYCTFIGWFQGSKQTAMPGFSEVVISSADRLLMEVVIGEKTIRFYQPLPLEHFQWLLK